MRNSYICPKCSSHLRILDNIILTFKKNEQKGLVLLSPEIGNYDIFYHDDSTDIKVGDKVEVHCPVCSENLAAAKEHDNLAHIIMIDEKGEKSDVFFSRIIGEEATFQVAKGGKVDKFGDDASNYNFWGYSL